MSADNIRGITIDIGASETKFKKSMNEIRKDAKSTQTELNALQKSLQLEFDPSKLKQAQKVAQDAIDNTAAIAEKLRERLKHLEETGKMDTSQYRRVQAELATTETRMQELGETAEKLNQMKLDHLADEVAKNATSSKKELDALQKSLQLEFDPSKLERAQKVAQEAYRQTAQQADILKQRMEDLEGTGKVDTTEYRRLQAELASVNTEMQELGENAKKLNQMKLDHLADEVAKNATSSKKELDALQKSLQLEFDPSKLERAQKVAQEAYSQTAQQADILKKRMEALEEKGEVDTTEYRHLQAELASVNTEMQEIEKNTEKLNQMKLDHLADQVKNVGEGFTKAGQALTPFSVAAGATLAGTAALGLSAVSTADEIATLATQYDMSAEALQRFNYIALQTDTDNETVYKSFVKMRAAIADIASGSTSVASTALKKLNLDLSSFDGSEEQFYGIIKTLADMEDKTQMVAIANDLFGEKLANNLLPMLYAGSDAIAGYAEEFNSLGALSDEQISSLAEFDNVMNLINTQMANTKLQIGQALLPVMESVAEIVSGKVVPVLQGLADWFGRLSPSSQNAIIAILGLVTITAPILMAIGKITTGISGLITMFGKLKAAQMQTVAGFAAILGAAALAFDMISNWKSMTWVEKLLKTMALAALVAAAAVTVFHASWSMGVAIAAITAGIVAGIAAINAAKKEILPEADDFTVDSIESTANAPSSDFGSDNPTGATGGYGTVYDTNDNPTSADVYNYDYSTTETTQNVTVVIENYAEDVDVDALVAEINRKLAEDM